MMTICDIDNMTLTLLVSNTTLVAFKLDGILDLDTSEDVLAAVQKILSVEQARTMIFDVHDLEYASSAGVGIFMSLLETVEEFNGEIIFVGVSNAFQRVLMLLGFMRYFPTFTTLNEAQDYLLSNKKSNVLES